jgi:hypothetical protein
MVDEMPSASSHGHNGRLSFRCCPPAMAQAACRAAGLWPGGDLRDMRKRLTVKEFAPDSLSVTEYTSFHEVSDGLPHTSATVPISSSMISQAGWAPL